MQLIAQMLHEAFLQAQREVYDTSEFHQTQWDNISDESLAAYERMAELLNEKQSTPDARLIAEAPAMFELIKWGLAIDANWERGECPCPLCVAARAIVKRVEE